MGKIKEYTTDDNLCRTVHDNRERSTPVRLVWSDPYEDGVSWLHGGEKKKDLRNSSGDKPVPCPQHVTAHDQRIGLVVNWSIQISQPQVGNRP